MAPDKKAKSKVNDSEVVKKEYTEEENARIAIYAERAKRNPVRFKKGINDSFGNPRLEVQETDRILGAVKMMEALGEALIQVCKFISLTRRFKLFTVALNLMAMFAMINWMNFLITQWPF